MASGKLGAVQGLPAGFPTWRTCFVVLTRRWVVERTFGWFSHWGGLLRERAGRLACVACLMAVTALHNPP